jgi:acetylornithine deacetylase/succinyl-diaminopimelate desuccinylase-like protein
VTDFGRFDAYVAEHAQRFFDELIAYGRQPSVSATGEGIGAMAPLVVATLRRIGAEASIVESPARHPAVIGEAGGGEAGGGERAAAPARRTVLLYDHYDVQPPGDPAAWSTPPWEPTLRGGELYGRGIADDKAELLARVHAIEAWQTACGALPVRVRWIIEGEHEIGSPGLAAVLRANRSRLEADVCLSEGTGRDEFGNVTINLGCRGFVSVELAVRLRSIPLASSLGGLLPSASDRLMRALLSIAGPDGDLLLDGVSEHVAPPSDEDEAMLRAIPWSDERARDALGIGALTPGMHGIDLLRHHLLEPFVAICAVNSGDPSWGLVVPGEALARLDLRLVPGLDPDLVVDLLRRHLDARGFTDVTMEVLAAVAPDRTDASLPAVSAAISAARDAEGGREPIVYPLMPAYSASRVFRDELDTPTLFAGAPTNASSNLHAPDEHIVLDEYLAYVRFFGRFVERLAAT